MLLSQKHVQSLFLETQHKWESTEKQFVYLRQKQQKYTQGEKREREVVLSNEEDRSKKRFKSLK